MKLKKTTCSAAAAAALALCTPLIAHADGLIEDSTSDTTITGGNLNAKGSTSISVSVRELRAAYGVTGTVSIGNFYTSDVGSIKRSTSKVKLDQAQITAKGNIEIGNFTSGNR